MAVSGHLWTILPRLHGQLRKPPVPPWTEWSTVVQDAKFGDVRLTGRLFDVPDASGLLVVVHGLGGSAKSPYLAKAVWAAREQGLACLCMNMRGSDRLGEDFYHAGLTDDLDAALTCPQLARYRDVYLFGYSLGGHIVLRWAVDSHDPRVRAVATVAAPLDLRLCAESYKQWYMWAYQRYLLVGLFNIYREVAAKRPVPLPLEEAAKVTRLWEWDDRIVAPRHGFRGAEDYYTQVSVAPHLERLRVPVLFVSSEGDPMVRPETVRPHLDGRSDHLQIRWVDRGGHLGFPDVVDLAVGQEPGRVERQVLGWLVEQG